MVTLIRFLADAYIILIMLHVLFSWIRPNPYNPLVRFVNHITDPPLLFIRKYAPTLGGLDFSPMILILAVYLLERLLIRILINI